MAAPGLDERFIGALHDALAADIDPRSGRHLAEHHQSFAVEFVKMLPRGPMRNQVRIGDQNARRIGMRTENADRLSGLHEQGFVSFQFAQRLHDAVERFPVARGTADAAVNDKLIRSLGHFRIEVVHQHAQWRFGQPALSAENRAARRPDNPLVIPARIFLGGVGIRGFFHRQSPWKIRPAI